MLFTAVDETTVYVAVLSSTVGYIFFFSKAMIENISTVKRYSFFASYGESLKLLLIFVG